MGWIKNKVFDNADKVIGIGAVIGGLFAAIGIGVDVHAHIVNTEANEIAERAKLRYEEQSGVARQTLSDIGSCKVGISNSLVDFATVIEKIQGRPEFRKNLLDKNSFSEISSNQIKELSIAVNSIVAGGAGAGVGALAGLAAFGANAVIIAPAAVFGGAVVMIQSFSFGKKAKKHLAEAKSLQDIVDKMCAFFEQVNSEGKKYIALMNKVHEAFNIHFYELKKTVDDKDHWKLFTKQEKKNCKEVVLIAGLLYELCKLEFIVVNDKDDINRVNTSELKSIEERSQLYL